MRKFLRSDIYIRNFIFGVEDSLVSTTGLLSGVAVANTPKETILLAGIILIFVEALSMGAGSFISEESAGEFIKGKATTIITIPAAIIMFLSYFFSGFIPLAPYLVFDTSIALETSIALSLVTLLLLGGFSAKVFNKNSTKSAIRMFVIGGLAIVVGIVVGNIANNLL